MVFPAKSVPVAMRGTGMEERVNRETSKVWSRADRGGILRQIEVFVANGKTMEQACKAASIAEQTYYRWRKEYGGLQVRCTN
jgi:transposase-like protein